jgi:hypothetical protein
VGGNVKITRVWAMPNKNTFSIAPIHELIVKYACHWIDPFPEPFLVDALVYLSQFQSNSQQGVLFDPPYSPRQLKECYESNGQALHNTTSAVWKNWKDEIARVIKPGGICISFGWSTNGLGKKRGFEIVEILLVAHGGNHNDTMVTVERKVNRSIS